MRQTHRAFWNILTKRTLLATGRPLLKILLFFFVVLCPALTSPAKVRHGFSSSSRFPNPCLFSAPGMIVAYIWWRQGDIKIFQYLASSVHRGRDRHGERTTRDLKNISTQFCTVLYITRSFFLSCALLQALRSHVLRHNTPRICVGLPSVTLTPHTYTNIHTQITNDALAVPNAVTVGEIEGESALRLASAVPVPDIAAEPSKTDPVRPSRKTILSSGQIVGHRSLLKG